MSSILLILSQPAAQGAAIEALNADPALAVAACVARLDAARAALAQRTPDLLIGDLQLPDGALFELLRTLRPERTHVLVLAASMHDPRLMHTLRLGADAVLPAGSAPADLVDAARATLAGESTIAPELARLILAAATPATGSSHALTAAERKLLEWAVEGYSAADIAHAVKATPQQVGRRMRAVLRGLHASQRGAPASGATAALRPAVAASR